MAPKVKVSMKHCKGCGLCVDVCPRHALKMSGVLSRSGLELVSIDENVTCSGCLLCTLMCPDAAITVEVEEESPAAPG
jgi:2-oxoglutarate ferredoxin oxidoreductase subunit delta